MTIRSRGVASITIEPATPETGGRRGAVVGGLVGGVAAVLLAVGWGLGFLTPAPAPVSLDGAAEIIGGLDSAASIQALASTAEFTVAGDWKVVRSDATFIGYRASGPTGLTVGRSSAVTGSLTAAETQVEAVEVTVDMSTLRSDSSLRDEHLGDQGFEYNTYQTASFSLTEPILLEELPSEGTEAEYQATGVLTIRDTPVEVVVDLQATVIGGIFVVVGATAIDLEDFGATVGATNKAVVEFSLVFAR